MPPKGNSNAGPRKHSGALKLVVPLSACLLCFGASILISGIPRAFTSEGASPREPASKAKRPRVRIRPSERLPERPAESEMGPGLWGEGDRRRHDALAAFGFGRGALPGWVRELLRPESLISRTSFGIGADPRATRAGLLLLGLGGPREALPILVFGLQSEEGSIVRAGEDATIRFLRRHSGSRTAEDVGQLATQRQRPASVRGRLLRCLARSASAASFEVLSRTIGREPDVDLAVLPSLAGLAPSLISLEQLDSLMDRVRPLHGSEHDAVRREAATVAAKALDVDSIEPLLKNLVHRSAGVRENALFALRAISGQKFPLDAKIWGEWWQWERQWSDLVAPKLVEDLAGRDVTRIVLALRDVARHPTFRDEVSQRIVELLEHDNVGVRLAASHALGSLRCWIAQEALLAAVEDADPRVSEAAALALQRFENAR